MNELFGFIGQTISFTNELTKNQGLTEYYLQEKGTDDDRAGCFTEYKFRLDTEICKTQINANRDGNYVFGSC